MVFACVTVVSASDVIPTERWLNVWCIWHTKVETLQEFQCRRRIGWIIQEFRKCVCVACVSRSLTSRLETKMPWSQTPSRKKKAVVFTAVTTNAYQDQINAGFSKICEIFSLQHRIFKIRLRVLHTRSVIVATFLHPKTWWWTKQTVIGCLTSVRWPHWWNIGQWKLP